MSRGERSCVHTRYNLGESEEGQKCSPGQRLAHDGRVDYVPCGLITSRIRCALRGEPIKSTTRPTTRSEKSDQPITGSLIKAGGWRLTYEFARIGTPRGGWEEIEREFILLGSSSLSTWGCGGHVLTFDSTIQSRDNTMSKKQKLVSS